MSPMAYPTYGTDAPESIETTRVKKEDECSKKCYAWCWQGRKVKKECGLCCLFGLLFTETATLFGFANKWLGHSNETSPERVFNIGATCTLGIVTIGLLAASIYTGYRAFYSSTPADEEAILI